MSRLGIGLSNRRAKALFGTAAHFPSPLVTPRMIVGKPIGSSIIISQLLLGTPVHDASASDLTVYTFAGQALGSAASDRRILVLVGTSGNTRTVSTLTIGGVSATQIHQVTNGNATVEAWSAIVPTGTTGDLVVTWSGITSRCVFSLYPLYDGRGSAYDTGDSVADPFTDTINVPAHGACFGLAVDDANPVTHTWSGLTEAVDSNLEGNFCWTAAYKEFPIGQNLTVTCTPTTTQSPRAMLLVSWGPG